MNHMRQEASNFEQNGGGDINWMKLVDGKNIIRILPPWSEEGRFFQRVGFHRSPNSYSDKALCVNFTFGRNNCHICKKGRSIIEQHGKDVAKPYWPGKRAYLNVLDMKAGDGIVRVLEVGPQILNPILNYIAELDCDDLIDPDKGFNILLTRKKEGSFTKYEVMVIPKPSNLTQLGYNVDAILEGLVDLSKLTKEPEDDKVLEILDGINSKVFEGGETQEDSQAAQSYDGNDVEIPMANQNGKANTQTNTQQASKPKTVIEDEDIRPASAQAQKQTTQQNAGDDPRKNQPQNDALAVAEDVSVDDLDQNVAGLDDLDITSDDVPF